MKEGASHVITGSRWHKGAKPSAGGRFNDSILCSAHEGATSGLDTYGTRFVRDVRAAYAANRSAKSLAVPNPQPRKLARFALSLIWRESHGDLDWPVMVSETRYHVGKPDPRSSRFTRSAPSSGS